MADSNVPITAGVGTNIDTFQLGGGDHQQVVREARATSETDGSWPVTTTGSSNVIGADSSRVFMLMVSQATARVYLRFDGTPPTTTAFHWFLDPDDRWEVPEHLSSLPVSMLGGVTGGFVLYHLGVAS